MNTEVYLQQQGGQIDMDNGLNIMKAGYKSSYCIFEFDTSPSLCHVGSSKMEKKCRFGHEHGIWSIST